MVAGTEYRSMFERMKKVIQQAEAANGKVVLFIDEVHMLLGAGRIKGGSMDGSAQACSGWWPHPLHLSDGS